MTFTTSNFFSTSVFLYLCLLSRHRLTGRLASPGVAVRDSNDAVGLAVGVASQGMVIKRVLETNS